MIIQFTLSMPNVGSWDRKWTGSSKLYAIVRSFNKKKAEQILEKPSYSYNFGDGWRAGVSAEQIDSKLAAKVRRKSQGFCGYNWMVDSIVSNLKIVVPVSNNT